MNIQQTIANELGVKIEHISATIALLEAGATVPFIARYRKEVTGGLDDIQLRQLETRLYYLREMNERRESIIKSINEQGKLTTALEQAILQAETKSALEDLYLPYKPKRRTKAQIAKEAGLEVLAHLLLHTPTLAPEEAAQQFICEGFPSPLAALEGARYILMEIFTEDAALVGQLRTFVWQHGILASEVIEGKETAGVKFSDYFSYQEAIHQIPSHRALALFRGQREEVLALHLLLSDEAQAHCQENILTHFNIENQNRPADAWLIEAARLTWKIKFTLKFELEAFAQLHEIAETAAIKVFASNLKNLLMAAPAPAHITMGLDPGLRTGVKVVVVDGTGKLLTHDVIYPHAPHHAWQASLSKLTQICKAYHVTLISIGNGTASRETDKLIAALKQVFPHLVSVVVSEAGASVYSASELASHEFPTLDVSYRGAVSIARRLQDPLAELIKIEPKAIGVGQYQHDVNQYKLSRALHAVMEDCVNAVGVDVNSASVPLLKCIAGLNETIAKNIVAYRDEHGAFKNRTHLKNVPRLGDKAYEQAAGFLRIINGENQLDASAVHPEAYRVVERILKQQQKPLAALLGNRAFLNQLKVTDYIDDHFGIPTVTDILRELEKPGRDPRPQFKTATFLETVQEIKDLSEGMLLEGVVTNVANFGAFVDIGVHQDGLVHISMLADRFVKDPHDVVKVGDIVKVKVLKVDEKRKRIQLTMRLNTEAPIMTKKQQVKENSLGHFLQAALERGQ